MSIIWKDPDINGLPPDMPCFVSLCGRSWWVSAAGLKPDMAGRVLLVFRATCLTLSSIEKAILADGSVAMRTRLGDVLSALNF